MVQTMASRERNDRVREGDEAVDAALRQAAVASEQLGRRPVRPDGSQVMGNFVGHPTQDWPSWEGAPMEAVLQIRVDELDVVPPALDGYAVVALFVATDCLADELYFDEVPRGRGWTLRTYETVDGLEPLKPPEFGEQGTPVRWHRVDGEAPEWEDLSRVAAVPDAFVRHEEAGAYDECYGRERGIKIGGWPWFYEDKMADRDHTYVFQIERSRWYGYVTRGDDGEWYLKAHATW